MDLSTLIILAIALFIIVYRIKTWNDTYGKEDNASVKEEKVSEKEKNTDNSVASETSSVTPTKQVPKQSTIKYRKKLNAKMAKNTLLVSCAHAQKVEGDALAFKAQPKKGVTTYVVLVEQKGDRALGVILERIKEQVTLLKSFDVKMAANGQFKVPTSFSKSQSVKVESLEKLQLGIDAYMGADEVLYTLDEISLELE